MAIRGNILLGFKLILRIFYLNIFKPLLAADWVLAGKLLEANKVYTAQGLVYRAIGIQAAYIWSLFCNIENKMLIIYLLSPILKPLV